jgi:AcrR family transcriptional regulator
MKIKSSKDAILNHALAIFGRLGFHKTTMADIANASKKGRRTIYMYFKNKEEVYEAVVEREIERVIELMDSELNQYKSATEKLNGYIGLRLGSVIRLTQYYDALRIAYQKNYKWVEDIRKKLDAEDKLVINQILTYGNETGEFQIEQVEISVKSILFLIHGIEFMLIKEDQELTTDTQIENLQKLITNGLSSQLQTQTKIPVK